MEDIKAETVVATDTRATETVEAEILAMDDSGVVQSS